ncbi:MAG TPA: S41 family peptidase [Micavibrio sp.]|jgi:carboxyl-terminal processing protease
MTFLRKTKGWLASAFLGASLLTGCAHIGPRTPPPSEPQPTPVQEPAPEPSQPESSQEVDFTPAQDQSTSEFSPKNYALMQFMQMMEVFGAIGYLHIEGNTLDARQMKVDAINGILRRLDPHSHYYTAEGYKAMLEANGRFSIGIGIEPVPAEKFIKIASLIKEGPAERAGLKANDLITHVDDVPVHKLGHDGAVKKIRGAEAGTSVALTIMRNGAEKHINVVREEIEPLPVNSAKIGKDIGYVSLAHFGYDKKGPDGKILMDEFRNPVEDGATLVRDAILALKKEMGPGIKAYILDLRGNRGGSLDQAVSIADHFMGAGKTVVSMRTRQDDRDQTKTTKIPGDIVDGKPVVVLVNEGSASASEILAGALQDHRRATIMGARTFGKGSVQWVLEQKNGDILVVTTTFYRTPNGHAVQGNGIMPDIRVVTGKEKRTLRESDFPHALQDKTGTSKQSKPQATCSPSGKSIPVRKLDEILTTIDGKPDYALLCAVEYARDKPVYTAIKPAVKPIP